MSPRVVQKEEVRARILDSARKIARSSGWPAVTMRKVAEQIDYTQPVVYEYFGDKDGMMLCLAEEGFRKLYQNVKTAYDRNNSPARRVEAIARAYWEMAVQDPELYQVMFGLKGGGCKQDHEIADADRTLRLAHMAVGELMLTSGKSGNPRMAAITLWSLLHGLVALTMADILHKKTDPAKAFNYSIKHYIAGYTSK
ncbi:MAG TPA: TetR/AcrR family transcriptional regulator [Candidatus Polarisedimenticolaceae bacterium]|nr:TetR/AcrR family transcriptional regulator [Candidatus Polarisedimenticolaceae bacterium]